MKVQVPQRLAAGVALIVLTACSSSPRGAKNAFDQLTYEGSRQSTPFATFQSVMSLSGLIPPHVPGALMFEPGNSMGSSLAPALSSGISPMCSYVVEARYALKAGQESRVQILRDAYLAMRVKAHEAAAALTRLAAARALTAAAVKVPGGSHGDDRRSQIAQAILNASTPSRAADKEVAPASSAMPNPATLTAAEEAPRLADLGALEAAAAQKRTELLTAANDFTKKISTPNILVTRWTREDNGSAHASAATLGTAGASSQGSVEGVLILGDIKVSSFIFGRDFMEFLKFYEGQGRLSNAIRMGSMGIVTNTISAKHVAYVSERSDSLSIAAQVGVSAQELQQFIDPNLDVELSGIYSIAANAANTAWLTSPTIEERRFAFWPPTNHKKALDNEITASNEYLTVYTVRGTVTTPLLLALGDVDKTFSSQCVRDDWEPQQTKARDTRRP